MQSTPKKSSGKRPAATGPKKTKKKTSAKDGKPTGGGAAAEGPAAAAERERKRLVAELEMTSAGLRAREAEAKGLQLELAALRLRHGEDVATAQDVLQSQRRERTLLEEAARTLEQQLEAARAETALLHASLQQALEAGTGRGQQEQEQGGGEGHASSKVQRLQCHSQQQAEHIAVQQEAIERLRQRLEHTEQSLDAERSRAAGSLGVRGQARSVLRFVRESPWLMHIRREQLRGVTPSAVPPGSCSALAGRQLLLEGSEAVQGSGGGGSGGQLHMLDLSTGLWSAVSGGAGEAPSPSQPPATSAPVSGRAMCGIGDKLLGVGGTCCGQLLGTKVFHPSLREWLPLPSPADASAVGPPVRHSAALAYCPSSHLAYLFGGQGEAGCLADLWCLDCTSMEWRQLDSVTGSRPGESARLQGSLEAPPPCAGAALAVSEDGSRLWLMGGRLDSQRCTNALYRYDLGLSYWPRVDAAPPIEPRANHAMACVGRFLVVVGGSMFSAGGQAAHHQDCALYDPTENSWDVLDGAAFEPDAGSSKWHPAAVVSVAAGTIAGNGTPNASKPGHDGEPAAFLGTGSCVFSGNKLLLLKSAPESGGQLGELWTVVLQLPGDIELLRESRRKAACIVKQLTLHEEEVCASSVRLGWTPATANRDRLVGYKLMVTNSEGRSQEAYEGGETSCQVTGLMPGSHVFCVKAVYDDASFQWSQPVMVVTLPGKRRPA